MLKVIYTDVKTGVRSDNTLSDCFEYLSRVKQVEPSSPLLFILFINDFYENRITRNNDYFTLNNIKLFLLLFSDDAVLFSYTKEAYNPYWIHYIVIIINGV